ncbi:MAG: hypothetical protein EOM67_07260 [Spirochaetia bacterium]|nr:hypothetical protein [Spirochaetia bacterium]
MKETAWQKEYEALREIIETSSLIEEFKWSVPCYTYHDSNVLLMHGFKEYCALLFVKGSLLKDENHLLISQTQHTQASRHLRFKSVGEIRESQLIIRQFIKEAIILEEEGRKVEFKPTSEFNIPSEFQQKIDESIELKIAFSTLSPGRQRGYLLYFSDAKQSKTRTARIEKYIPFIIEGKGLHD